MTGAGGRLALGRGQHQQVRVHLDFEFLEVLVMGGCAAPRPLFDPRRHRVRERTREGERLMPGSK